MTQAMTIWVASDHAGYRLKEQILTFLRTQINQDHFSYTVYDGGPYDDQRVDYPALAWPLTQQVASNLAAGQTTRGILICGTGIGVSLVANRHPDIRAALAHDLFTAEMARRHNDAHILCLGARIIDQHLASAMVKTFLETPFDGGRHANRIQLLHALDPHEDLN